MSNVVSIDYLLRDQWPVQSAKILQSHAWHDRNGAKQWEFEFIDSNGNYKLLNTELALKSRMITNLNIRFREDEI
jgi:hypothetical protein